MTEPPQSSGLTRRRAGDAQGTPGAPGTRRWNAESRWRAFLRPSDYRTPGSFDEASERFSLNLPYYLSQYAAIGALTVLGGALLSGGVTFVLAVIVALLLTIIAISLTSRIELSNSTRFLVFLFVTSCSLFPNLLHTPFSCSLFSPSLPQWFRSSFGSQRTCVSVPSASSSGSQVCFRTLQHCPLLCSPMCEPSLYPAQCVQNAL